MDPDSPFANLPKTEKILTKKICINYCDNCHYVWKAPTKALACINCKFGNTDHVHCLVEYDPGIPTI